MIDTSNYTLDTPVKIKIMHAGYYIPELKTSTPLISFASIDKVISIMNRGIEVEFPEQDPKIKEISSKIEDILLDYRERKEYIKETKNIDVGTNVNTALDTVQNINDSTRTIADEIKEKDKHIFDYTDIASEYAKNLSNDNINNLFNSDDFISASERIRNAEIERKARNNIKLKKKSLLQDLSDITAISSKLLQDAHYEDQVVARFNGVEFSDTITKKKKYD